VSELVGTFVLVLVVVGAICLNFGTTITAALIPGAYGRLLLTGTMVGLAATGIIYSAVGRTSGAHLNPAVTLAFVLEGQLSWLAGLRYAAAQVVGAVAAAAAAALLWPGPAARVGYGMTVPAEGISPMAAAGMEAAATFVLIAVIFYCLHHPRVARVTGAAVGLTVLAIVAAIGVATGASANPARSLGPGLVAGTLDDAQWVYVVGPLGGAALAALVHRVAPFLRRPMFFHLHPHLPHLHLPHPHAPDPTTPSATDPVDTAAA
jgi:aquaporin Z